MDNGWNCCSGIMVFQVVFCILSVRNSTACNLLQVGKKNNCTFCGVFRRQALDRGANLLKVDAVATGHNADDIAETILMNILRGDIARLQRCTAIITVSNWKVTSLYLLLLQSSLIFLLFHRQMKVVTIYQGVSRSSTLMRKKLSCMHTSKNYITSAQNVFLHLMRTAAMPGLSSKT